MKRRKPLVSQFLERVSGVIFEAHQDVIRDFVSRQHGVYALYHGDDLYYVGLASNLRTRLNKHLKDRHAGLWNRFSVYLTMNHEHMRELESLVVRITLPQGNKQIGRFAKAENLFRRLNRSIRQKQRRELDYLLGPVSNRQAHVGRQKRSKKLNGQIPVMAEYVSRRTKLRRRYKGELLQAQILKNGMIRFNGKLYSSPSRAAAAAVKRRSCNGWAFWTYEVSPKKWVPLKQLRR